jgi:hypothetical protein
MSKIDDRNINPITEMMRIAQDILRFELRGFKETYRSEKSPQLIYDSVWCRISLVWGGWDYGSGNTMHIYYGRLHAPNEKETMLWNGEKCHCWHGIEQALHFLDGRTPADTAELDYSHPVTDSFYEEENEQKYESQPEWMAHMHVAVWEHYGDRMFGLFDLRQPDLWKQYQQFLKDVYDIKGRIDSIQPPLDRVC